MREITQFHRCRVSYLKALEECLRNPQATVCAAIVLMDVTRL